MSDIAVQAERLSKRYLLGEGSKQRHDTFRDHLSAALKSLGRRRSRTSSAGTQDSPSSIWALKDVSFEIKRGEVIGFIGRNGAGKSTLLKVLSRITKPTAGFAEIRGRVASLLEVGTGFHGELTGRENIYLNGAMLGMKRVEIQQKFDAIVEFSGVEKFIDTPVKRYSSGMYVRLAFAVAAHLEPEILIIDEVLAVGDLAFQKKCLGKMGEVARSGTTVLLVSHHMPSILGLCSTAILLEAGQIAFRGPSSAAVEKYLNSSNQCTAEKLWDSQQLSTDSEPFRPISMRVCNSQRQVCDLVRSTELAYIEMTYEVKETLPDFRIQLKL